MPDTDLPDNTNPERKKTLMQINLKQPEIIKALQRYIAQLGINLKNKDVAIKFTAGRGEAGLSADIVITEGTLPDFGVDEEAPTPAVAKLALVSDSGKTAAPVEEPAPEDRTTEPVGPEPMAAAPVAVKTASLFN